jgi:hypothetical protein
MTKARIAFVVQVSIAATATPVWAANGDNLRYINANRDGTACADGAGGIGVGLAFDGANLLMSCYSDNTITAVSPADGSQVAIHPISGASSLGSMAWDNGRHLLWACSAFDVVGTIDLNTNAFTPVFTSLGCFDGLAYDASDDSIWSSGDVAGQVQHYSATGVPLGNFEVGGLLGGSCGNSGIAVGGPKLYLANNGCSQIYEAEKNFSATSLFATFPARLEDLECDNVTFSAAGKAAIWSVDAYDNQLNAWEIPDGACAFGGGGCQDGDADGVCDDADNCPVLANADQADADQDGQGDACDVCPQDAQNDADHDGVCGNVDVCSGTVLPESVPTVSLGVNRFADTNGDGVFDTTLPAGQGPLRSYTLQDTKGCSCEQIIASQKLGEGHRKFGCSISAMDDWIAAHP